MCTIEAVCGGTRSAKANGSALSSSSPTRADLELVAGAVADGGKEISQIPDPPSARIMCRRPSQKLKSPTTETERAAGAHTANDVPDTPSS